MLKALGCHVFAGGFTQGVRHHFEVKRQLEVHNFGRETVESMGVEFYNCPADQWPAERPHLLFGNPRCTGFSAMNAHAGTDTYGHCVAATRDIRELVEYGRTNAIPVVIWESVQQAMTVGRPLVDEMAKLMTEKGYYVTHLLLNGATFGSAQYRKRYYFVATAGRPFLPPPPKSVERHTTAKDVLGPLEDLPVNVANLGAKRAVYGPDSYNRLIGSHGKHLAAFRQGESINELCKRDPAYIKRVDPELFIRYLTGTSDENPLGFTVMSRLRADGPCPTLIGRSHTLLAHYRHDRLLTVRELCALMGWDPSILPLGSDPCPQIAKGVCPCVAKWVAYWAARWCRQDVNIWAGDEVEAAGPRQYILNYNRHAPDRIPFREGKYVDTLDLGEL
jgi:site-specific DNA-cytosine methylase